MAKSKRRFYWPERDGVTQGALTNWLRCRQMSLWSLVEGWSIQVPSMALTYGSLSHNVLEGCYSDIRAGRDFDIQRHIAKAEKAWRKENPRAGDIALEQLEMSIMYTEIVLPLYFDHWGDTDREWLKPEAKFEVPMLVQGAAEPCMVSVPIRGRIDGAFRYREGEKPWLFETKHLSRIVEATLIDKLPFDLQTQLYLWALWQLLEEMPAGFVYNVIRRPQLRLKQHETLAQFRRRLDEDIQSRREFYFMRFELAVTDEEMSQIAHDLHQLVGEFVSWVHGNLPTYRSSWNCENKYGRCPYLSMCLGEDRGLYARRRKPFMELEDA